MSPKPLENLLMQSPMGSNSVGLPSIQSNSAVNASGPTSQMMSNSHNGNMLPAGGDPMSLVAAANAASGGNRAGSISLAMLFDFIIQRSYHELITLAERLPSKSDIERKAEIHTFSARTRQLFIRLLALVKWANSASKVDKSASIMSFLDKQSMLFTDTADMLARMARETLVHARLPNFHIHAAVEVLTTGNYARLPACIREKIIPAEAITVTEKKSTLQRLNQVIQYRLVSGELLPQMRKFRIENGRVVFRIEHEFEVSLTLMGDAPKTPWRLLDIEILVEDKDTGGGKALVHSAQVAYVQQVLQARLADSSNALEEVYNCLHYFCQSVQLEVMFTQTLKLKVDRLGSDVDIDDYMPGERLTISYWRTLTATVEQNNAAATDSTAEESDRLDFGFQLTIQSDPFDKTRPLAIAHLPSMGDLDAAEIAERAVRSDVISMERLLVHTIFVRSLARLADVRTEFQKFLTDVDYHLQGTPAILTVPVLLPCLRAEQIHITVDTHTGRLRCHVPKHLDCPVIADLEIALNGKPAKLPALVSELRYWITVRRCEKTLQHLPASPHERLPLLHAVDHPIARLGKHKLFVRFHRHPTVVLVVEIRESTSNPCEMDFNFHLVHVRHSSIDDRPNTLDAGESDVPKVYLRVQTLVELDTFVATHGTGTYVDAEMSSPLASLVSIGSKRKVTDASTNTANAGPSAIKQPKNPSYFVPELAHIVNMCDEKLPFVCLAQELEARGITHSGLQIEANATALVLKLLALPLPAKTAIAPTASGDDEPSPAVVRNSSLPVIGKGVWDSLTRRLLVVAIRAHPGVWSSELFWSVEFVFNGAPLRSTHVREQGARRSVTVTLPGNTPSKQTSTTVDCLLEEWKRIVYLYCLVEEFVEQYRTEKLQLQQHICIKSYNFTSLLIGYGRNREITVKIFWCNESSCFRLVFTGSNAFVNAHSLMREHLQAHLNTTHNLAQLIHLLHETYEPMASIAKLAVIPHTVEPKPNVPVLSFCVLPQSTTTVKVVYQLVYCLEVCLRGGGLVSIRDGAHSRFAKRNVLEEFTPTQGLQSFLSKYVDETAVYRRRSPFEDDHPPSPAVIIDDSHGGPSSVGSSSFLGNMRGPQSPRDAASLPSGGLRFPPPLTPPTISNPLTPASPHHSQQLANSLSNNFGMTSPPPSMPPASPLNPLPSPMASAHSPGPNNLGYIQSHSESSPFGVMSPVATGGSNWPGSPGLPRPSPRPGQSPEHKQMPHISRVLPARSWAGATPTLLTEEALETLCRPGPHPQKDIPGPELCPLERFLGCCFMRRQLQRFIHTEEFIVGVPCDQPGIVLFRSDYVHCQVGLNPAHYQSLHIKITQVPSGLGDQQKPMPPPFQWSPDDLQVLELFFDTRVVIAPYRPIAMCAFIRLLTIPPQVLRDFVQIMRLELMPERLPGLKWHVQFCMRTPPTALPPVPASVVLLNKRILFFLHITRIPYMANMEWKDCATLPLPIIYDISTNTTQLVERREVGGFTQASSMAAVSNMLRRFSEYSTHPNNECSLFAAVRDLLVNFTMPNEQQSLHHQQQQMQNQRIIPSPAGVASSPNPMMHSPMQMNQQQQMIGPQPVYGGPGMGMGPGVGGPGPN